MPVDIWRPTLVAPVPVLTPDDAALSLKWWLKADAEVYKDAGVTLAVDGDLVQQWSDQSISSIDVSNTSGKPTYKTGQVNGKPAVQFSGAQRLRNLAAVPSTVTDNMFFGVVVKTTVTNLDGQIARFGVDNQTGFPSCNGYGPGTTQTKWSMNLECTASNAQGCLINTTLWEYFEVYREAGTFKMALSKQDCTVVFASEVPRVPTTQIWVGGNQAGTSSRYFTGFVAEIFFFDAIPTLGQRQGLQSYVNDRYALWVDPPEGELQGSEIADAANARVWRERQYAEANRARPIIELRDEALVYKLAIETEAVSLTETPVTVKAPPTEKVGSDPVDLELQDVRTDPERQVSGQVVTAPERFPYPGATTKQEDTKYMGFAAASTARRTIQALESGRFAGRLPYSNSFSPVVASGEEFEKYPTPNEDIRQNLSHLIVRKAPLDPTSIRGLVLWLKPEDLPGVGNPSDGTLWPDSSGKANNGVFGPQTGPPAGVKTEVKPATLLNNGIVNYRSLFFGQSTPANTQGMDITGPNGTQDFDVATWTMFMVCFPEGSPTGPSFGRVGTFQLTWRSFGGPGPEVFNSVGNSTDAFPGGGWQIMTARQEGPVDDFPNPWLKTWTNAVWSGSKEWNPATYASSPTGRFMFGAKFAGDTPRAGGMAEFLFYNRALTEAERYSVEVYLFDKFRFTIGAIGPYVDTRWTVA